MKKYSQIFIVLVLMMMCSCSEEIPSTLIDTCWEYNVSGDLAWLMIGEKGTLPKGVSAKFTGTLHFKNNAELEISSNSIKIIGEDSTINAYNQLANYTYDSNSGKVTVNAENEIIEGFVNKNKLSVSSGLQTIVFLKK